MGKAKERWRARSSAERLQVMKMLVAQMRWEKLARGRRSGALRAALKDAVDVLREAR